MMQTSLGQGNSVGLPNFRIIQVNLHYSVTAVIHFRLWRFLIYTIVGLSRFYCIFNHIKSNTCTIPEGKCDIVGNSCEEKELKPPEA